MLVALALLSTRASAFPWTNGEPRQYARGEGVEGANLQCTLRLSFATFSTKSNPPPLSDFYPL